MRLLCCYRRVSPGTMLLLLSSSFLLCVLWARHERCEGVGSARPENSTSTITKLCRTYSHTRLPCFFSRVNDPASAVWVRVSVSSLFLKILSTIPFGSTTTTIRTQRLCLATALHGRPSIFVISARPECSPFLLFSCQCTYLLNIPDILMEHKDPSFHELPSARE